jgi:hypothetical protein
MAQTLSQIEKASFQLFGVKRNDTLSQQQNKGSAIGKTV